MTCSNNDLEWDKELGKIKESREGIICCMGYASLYLNVFLILAF